MDNLKTYDQVNFIAALALHQHRRDCAIGLSHVTTQTRGLLWYYNVKMQDVAIKSFHYGVIIGARRRIRQIKRTVKVDTPIEEANRLYQEALILQEQIDKAQKIIDG